MTGILKGYQIAKKGGKLLVDFETNMWLRPVHRYHPREKIVYDSLEEIIRKGYKPCYGYKSDLAYAFVPVYIKMTGFQKCEYRQGWVNLYTGQPCGMKDAGAVP